MFKKTGGSIGLMPLIAILLICHVLMIGCIVIADRNAPQQVYVVRTDSKVPQDPQQADTNVEKVEITGGFQIVKTGDDKYRVNALAEPTFRGKPTVWSSVDKSTLIDPEIDRHLTDIKQHKTVIIGDYAFTVDTKGNLKVTITNINTVNFNIDVFPTVRGDRFAYQMATAKLEGFMGGNKVSEFVIPEIELTRTDNAAIEWNTSGRFRFLRLKERHGIWEERANVNLFGRDVKYVWHDVPFTYIKQSKNVIMQDFSFTTDREGNLQATIALPQVFFFFEVKDGIHKHQLFTRNK